MVGGGLVDDHLGIEGIHILTCEGMEGVNRRLGIKQRYSTFNCSGGDFVYFR